MTYITHYNNFHVKPIRAGSAIDVFVIIYSPSPLSDSRHPVELKICGMAVRELFHLFVSFHLARNESFPRFQIKP